MAAEPTLAVDNVPHVSTVGPFLEEHEAEEEDEGTSLEPEDDLETLPDIQNTQSQNPPKRKGGRKPIYATVEERKQRNRQAQAAFRERRTEYIKQLENTLKQHEELLQHAQRERQATAFQSASLQNRIVGLERILHEHGFDIESELRARGEQTFVRQEAPILPEALNHPSGSGVRRSLKHNGSVGNTKLDLLKAKAATTRDAMVSPMNSPQSQTSMWHDHSSPHSTVLTSPIATQHEAGPQALYAVTQSPLSANNEYVQHHLGMPFSSSNQMGIPHGFNFQDTSFRAKQLRSSLDGSMNVQAGQDMRPRFSGDWDPERAPKIAHNPHTEHSPTSEGASSRLAGEQGAPSQYQDARSRHGSYLTMPEGFSQEIFPLSYPNSATPFPGQSISHTKKSSDAPS